ncbi:hypothetical protein [Bacillus swezeyi]
MTFIIIRPIHLQPALTVRLEIPKEKSKALRLLKEVGSGRQA